MPESVPSPRAKIDLRIKVIKVTPTEGYYLDNKHGDVAAGIKMLIGAAVGKTLDDSIERKAGAVIALVVCLGVGSDIVVFAASRNGTEADGYFVRMLAQLKTTMP